MRASLGLLAATLFAAALGVTSARAQPADDAAAREQAVVLYTRAEERYREGDYQTAALLLREAIELHEAAAMHYNLGKALEGMEDSEGAIAAYERFLELAPEHPQRASVRATIEELRAAEPEPEPVVLAPEPEVPETELEPGARHSAGPWVVLGLAALPLGAAIGTGIASANAVDDAEDAPDQPAAKDDADRARRFARVANASFAIAGALAIAGVVWALVDRTGDDGSGAALHLGPGGVELRARW